MVAGIKDIGVTIDKAALNVALVSDISFESAKSQIEHILNVFSEPNVKAAEMMAKMICDLENDK